MVAVMKLTLLRPAENMNTPVSAALLRNTSGSTDVSLCLCAHCSACTTFPCTQCDAALKARSVTQTLHKHYDAAFESTRMSCSRTLYHREPELNPLYDTTILFLVRYPILRNIAV